MKTNFKTAVLFFCATLAMGIAPATAQENSKALDVEKRVSEIVAEWEAWTSVFDEAEIYCAQIKELTEIGAPAVAPLCAALDRTTRDVPLRFIPFTLRAIGDPRAVPALIRAIPKTLRPSGSDCGITVDNSELQRFMEKHDIATTEGHPRDRRTFDSGRPVREVATTLFKLTGARQNGQEVFSTFIGGSEQQRALQRKAFRDVAEKWAAWWSTNAGRFVRDPAYTTVGLPPAVAAEIHQPSNKLPSGPDTKVGDSRSGYVLSPSAAGDNSAFHLGLSRRVPMPENIANAANENSFEDVTAWAERVSVDLIGATYKDSESGKEFYCLRGVGLQAWELPQADWTALEEKLKRGELPSMETPARDFLMHYDREKQRFRPEKKATFLFLTRDGIHGLLHLTAQVTHTNRPSGMFLTREDETGEDQRTKSGFQKGAQFDFKFIYTETEAMKREEMARQEERAARDELRRKRKLAKLIASHPPLNGIVKLPDGQPAAGATLLLAGPREGASLAARAFQYTNDSTIVSVSDSGSFTVPRLPGGSVFVVHEKGVARVTLDGATSPLAIQLQGWGAIQGTLIRGGKPAPNEKLAVVEPYSEGARFSLAPDVFRTESDADGRFTFTNLPPGELQIFRAVNNRYYEGQSFTVPEGATGELEYRLDGRTLKGRLVTSNGSKVEWKNPRAFRFSTKRAEKPDTRISMNFQVDVEPSGEFQIKNVPSGVYDFRGELREGPQDEFFPTGKVLGRLKHEVVVPQEEAASATPVALGNVTVEMVTVLEAGDVAPEFEAKTLAGQPLRLADFRGKYLLLDFWATWCGPCRAAMPEMKEIFAQFGTHPKFALVGLSLDADVDAPADYVKKEKLGWTQAFLGEWSATKVPTRYGVEGIPATFLIDPAGKIVGINLPATEIKSKLNEVLAAR